MRLSRLVTILLFSSLSKQPFCQTIDRMFSSNWADTRWTFIFKKDGTYQRISNGHYGNTTVNGAYEMRGDTIELLTGFEKTHRTVNPLYIIDKNGFLIDLWLRYDYAPFKGGNTYVIGPSRKRDIKYPQIDTDDSSQKADLLAMIREIYATDTVRQYFQNEPIDNDILLSNYYMLNDSTYPVIYSGQHKLKFIAPEKITGRFYIEIDDINMNSDEVEIHLIMHDRDKRNVWVKYFKEQTKWQLVRMLTF